MRRTRIITAAAIMFCAWALSACAPSISASDLMRPNFGRNPNPTVLLDPPFVINGQSGFSVSQSPCLPANYRCSPQAQVQWAENAFH
jgi:hypothetical protein